MALGGSQMSKPQNNNIRQKYVDSKNYQKHFSFDDRIKIQKIITEHRNEDGSLSLLLKDIGNMIDNDPSTISKEVKLHRVKVFRRDYSSLSAYNDLCDNYNTCTKAAYINELGIPCYKKKLGRCINSCSDFIERVCPYLNKFPWVCNGCPKIKGCRLNKYFYYSDRANNDYKVTLVESRIGINLSKDTFSDLNELFTNCIKEKAQPISHFYIANEDKIPVCERTLYNYVEKGYFDVKNIDLRRKITYKVRKVKKISKAKLKEILIGRSYEDYIKYINNHPNASIVQMDTVEGTKGENEPLLLTLHFIKFNFQIAYLIPSKERENIKAIFDNLQNELGYDLFSQIFEVILTDNGVEFSNPDSLEVNQETGEVRCKIFYCHPYSSYEKGSCEKNHEYIRYILPKGTSFKNLIQNDIFLMMSHINSTIRPGVKASPYDLINTYYGIDLLKKLRIDKIDPQLVILKPKLLK